MLLFIVANAFILKKKITVSILKTTEAALSSVKNVTDPEEQRLLRTLTVNNVQEAMMETVLCYLENPNRKGGQIERHIIHTKERKLTVQFSDKRGKYSKVHY